MDSNYSYSSATKQSFLYKNMFPDSAVTQSYSSGESKSVYIVKYSLTEYSSEEIKKDGVGSPFTLKFDKTTTKQVKKQYDLYLGYWSKEHNCVINIYVGSLFIGHCDANDLVT